jgi:hypothetical protein
VRKLVTHPAFYLPRLIVLGTVTLAVTLTVVVPAWTQWKQSRALVWSDGPWTITTGDFPAGTATDLPPHEDCLEWDRETPALHPWGTPGLTYVLDGLGRQHMWIVADGGEYEQTWSLSGVRVGETAVYASAGPMTYEHSAFMVADVISQGSKRAALRADATAPHRVVEYEVIGDWGGLRPGSSLGDPDAFGDGEQPYYGNRVETLDRDTGERMQVIGVATVVDDALVAVGTVTPAGVEPGVDAVELLERLVAKVGADGRMPAA